MILGHSFSNMSLNARVTQGPVLGSLSLFGLLLFMIDHVHSSGLKCHLEMMPPKFVSRVEISLLCSSIKTKMWIHVLWSSSSVYPAVFSNMIIHPTIQAGNVGACPHLPPSSPTLSYNLDSAHLLCQTVHQATIISHMAHCRKLLSVCWPPSLFHKAAILLQVQQVQWPTVVWKISGNILLGVLLLQTSPASSWASFLSFAHWALRFLISKKKKIPDFLFTSSFRSSSFPS